MARIMRREGDVSKRSLWQKIKDVALLDVGVIVRGGVSAGNLERLEELLLEADFGVPVTLRLVAEVEGRAAKGKAKTEDEFHDALR
ncbi:MAG TPA: signal recognition particle receptor subunit alpha, partial [Gemmatimonadaceae bacterium]|nr:signal recognition particle receptor subunit alpha [Gemmatimonadaceae bacterium]